MKINGFSFRCERPFFVYFKKHYCPHCHNKLERKKVSEIVHSDSAEAKNYDFFIVDEVAKGNVKFSHIEFYCPACNRQYAINDIKNHESAMKK